MTMSDRSRKAAAIVEQSLAFQQPNSVRNMRMAKVVFRHISTERPTLSGPDKLS